jgi:hypothetical protein
LILDYFVALTPRKGSIACALSGQVRTSVLRTEYLRLRPTET